MISLPITGQDHEEEVMTMEEDSNQPAQATSTEELRCGTTIQHRRVNYEAPTGDIQREVSRSSPLDPSVRELAGFPRRSLPNAGIQELAEHPHQRL